MAQEAMGQMKNHDIPSERKKKLFHCEGNEKLEEIACRCKISICGDI